MSSIDEKSRLDFVVFARRGWASQVYPFLVEQVRRLGGEDAEPSEYDEQWFERVSKIRPLVLQSSVYPFFAWLERGLQKQLWKAVNDILSEGLPDSELECSSFDHTLELDDDLQSPSWYTGCDFHLQPNGVWPSMKNGAAYELGARVVMLGANDQAQFHRIFTDTAVPDRDFGRIVDLGCGFGKSTFPLKIRFPDAEVIGIDLAGPLLKMAWKRAQRAGLEVKLRQADCRCTGLDSASIDLVTATMLIHELPVCAIEETLAEAARVLRSGGLLRLLDFHATGDPVRDLAMMEHSQRNNEPFLADLFRTDVVDLCKRVGFADACWVAFDERQVGRLNQLVWPKRREWHFPWAVLEARLP